MDYESDSESNENNDENNSCIIVLEKTKQKSIFSANIHESPCAKTSNSPRDIPYYLSGVKNDNQEI